MTIHDVRHTMLYVFILQNLSMIMYFAACVVMEADWFATLPVQCNNVGSILENAISYHFK
jgi:hypothetical protein